MTQHVLQQHPDARNHFNGARGAVIKPTTGYGFKYMATAKELVGELEKKREKTSILELAPYWYYRHISMIICSYIY